MKKVLILFAMTMMSAFTFAQRPVMRMNIDFSKYEKVDSLPLEMISVHFDKEIDDENAIDLGGGEYLLKTPHKDKMVIRVNSDKTKAIVAYNSFVFGRHFEFNLEENEKRVTLWYKDSKNYCGYIYDKYYKVCKYFESKKEFKRWSQFPRFR